MLNKEEICANMPILETERLILRKLTMEDAADMFEYASEPLVSRFVPWEVHKSIEDSREFLRFIINNYEKNNKLTWAIELKNEQKMIGTIDFVKWIDKHCRAEIAYVLSHHYWGKGLTHEAARGLAKFSFEKMGLNKIEASIVPSNFQSQRVLEKLGMKREGVARQHFQMKGELADLAMYSVLRDEFI